MSMAACGAAEEELPSAVNPSELTASDAQNAEQSEPKSEEPAAVEENESAEAAEEYAMVYNGVTITLNAPAKSIVEALGEPMSYSEMPSCAFEGLDKSYYYGGFYLDTYPEGDEDFVYGFWFADDSLSTEEGIYIGASQAEVEAAYDQSYFNGSNAYVIPKGTGKLTILLEGNVVTSIQYAIEIQ